MKRIIVLLSMAAALLVVTFPAAAAPPTNDNFADAQVVTIAPAGQQVHQAFTTIAEEATTEPGENLCANQYSVWFTFTLTETKNVGISADALPVDFPPTSTTLREARVGLYAADGQTLLRCQADGAHKNAVFVETLNAGTYYVQVGADAAPFVYRVFFQEQAPNDNFANAQDIPIPPPPLYSQQGILTKEPNEPACGQQYTVWYKFTLERRTTMQFYASMPNLLFSRDLSFGLFRDDGGLTLITCRQGPEYDVAFRRTLDAGTYYIQMGGMSHPHYFYIHLQTTPENDAFNSAKKINFPLEDRINAALATFEPGAESHGSASCGGTLYHTVWYKFKLTEKMTVILKADGDIFLDDKPIGDELLVFPVQWQIYMDLWEKSGTGKTPLACVNRIEPEIKKTLNPGTYFVRLASTQKAVKRMPSYYTFNATALPTGKPVIVDQPDETPIASGESAVLSVVATGRTPMTYQWYAGQAGDTSNPISGATAEVYTTPTLIGTDNYYWVRVTNAAGSRDSATARVSAYTSFDDTELLDNGGFETGAAGWAVQNLTGDKVRCETGTRPAQGNDSSCAFVFKGGTSEQAKLIQQASSMVLAEGESLRLKLFTKSTGAAGKLKAVIKVTPSDPAAQVQTFKVVFAPSADYMLWQSDFFEVSGVDALLDTIVLTFTHTSASGKTSVDDVSLVLARHSASRSSALLPVPAAPDGFRGGN